MTTHEQWIKCNCYDYRANNNAVTWQREKNFIILYSKKYTLKKCILINTFAFCRMLPSWSVFCHLTKVRRQQFRWWCQMMSVFFHFQPTINIFFNNCKWGGLGLMDSAIISIYFTNSQPPISSTAAVSLFRDTLAITLTSLLKQNLTFSSNIF